MDNLSTRLRNKIDVYDKVLFENEFREKEHVFKKIKSVYAAITVTKGKVNTYIGETVFSEITHKVVIRKNALKRIGNDMYFIYNNAILDVSYYLDNYKYKDCIEIYCIQRIE